VSVCLFVCLFACLTVHIFVGLSSYQKLWKQYMKQKHLAANRPKVASKDREKLRTIDDQLQDIRLKG